ncbi:MAG: hypothetical protein ABI867_10655 [Kofleriaceae bacterium]
MDRRSGIPRVLGILALAFACIGLFHIQERWNELGRLEDVVSDRTNAATLWAHLWLGVSVVLFLLEVAGGALAVMYRKLGPRLLTSYAIGAIVLIVADFALMGTTTFHDAHDRHGVGFLLRGFVNLCALPWPIVVVALVNTRRAKAACS